MAEKPTSDTTPLPKKVSQLIRNFNSTSFSPSSSSNIHIGRPVAQVSPTQRIEKPIIPTKPTNLSKPGIQPKKTSFQPAKTSKLIPSFVKRSESENCSLERKKSGKTVQILKIEQDSFQIDTEAITKVLDKVPDLPIVIISINGSSREGKSYVLNYFIRYLTFQDDPNWARKDLPPESLFSWRSGRERDTVGINLYTEPFTVKQCNREVAVLLLDCQGLFDQYTTFRQNAVIYALSNLLSSVMIYNVKCKVEENLLQNIQYFSSYAKAISTEEAIEDELPHFMFLLRDFSFFPDYQYGFHKRSTCPSVSNSGNYFEDTMFATEAMPVENQSVRNEILDSYSDVGMYLMPFPGRNFVANSIDNEPDPDFLELLEQFILLMVRNNEHLVTKKIGGIEVTGQQLKEYIQIWGDECEASATMFPEARTIGDSTILLQNEVAANNAFASYKQNFSKFIHSDDAGVSDEDLLTYHSDLVAYALRCYKSSRTLGGESMVESYSEKIQTLCENIFQETYVPMNAEIRRRNQIAEEYAVNKAATEAYIRKMQYQIEQLQQQKGESSKLEQALAEKQQERQQLEDSRIEIKSQLQADIQNAIPQLGKQREYFAGVKGTNFSVKKAKVTKKLYLHELSKAKMEKEELQQEQGSWNIHEEQIYSQPYEYVPQGTQGSYRAIQEDDMATKLAQEEKEKKHAAKLIAATKKIESMNKKIQELEQVVKHNKKKPWWQFW